MSFDTGINPNIVDSILKYEADNIDYYPTSLFLRSSTDSNKNHQIDIEVIKSHKNHYDLLSSRRFSYDSSASNNSSLKNPADTGYTKVTTAPHEIKTPNINFGSVSSIPINIPKIQLGG